jgi:putative transposase
MSPPRLIRPGTYRHVSRRITQRLFLLLPDDELRELFVWCLAEGSKRYGVKVLRFVILSNHYHLMLFDEAGVSPDFLRWVHREIARGVQRHRGLDPGSGSVFERSEQAADQIIASEEAFWKMMHYLHANPVDAGICKRPEDWPGVVTPAGVSELHAKRPEWMTDRSGPEEHTLQIHVPEHFAKDAASYEQQLRDGDAAYVQALRATMRQEGRHHFKGADKAMRRSPRSRPVTKPKPGSSAFVAVTAVAIACTKAMLKDFYEAYAEALDRFRRGLRDTLFPDGTWKMTRVLKCKGAASCL